MSEHDTRYYYFRLASESSLTSADDSESVYSIQDRETDLAQDTADTDSKSELDEYDVLEYELASSPASEDFQYFDNSSSGTEDIFVEGAIAAAICDNSLENWATDGETSDSTSEDIDFGRTQFGTCVQCNSQNQNPHYRYCEKCYQVRKTLFPPRPRGRIKKKKQKLIKPPAVKLDALRSCLKGLSQDSGIGSSQEIQSLNFDEIVVPDHLKVSEESSSECLNKKEIQDVKNKNIHSVENMRSKRKRSLEEEEEVSHQKEDTQQVKKFKPSDDELICSKTDIANVGSESDVQPSTSNGKKNVSKIDCTHFEEEIVKKKDVSETTMCILCFENQKNSVFLHTGVIGHMCCCYKCAIRTWNINKKCPMCNGKIKNVVKVVT